MIDPSAERAKRRRILEPLGATMTTATQRAGLVTLLALTAATTAFLAQTRAAAATDHGYPAYYCAPIKADSSDDQKAYCDGWRVIRKGW
jgi:hypothetical protein